MPKCIFVELMQLQMKDVLNGRLLNELVDLSAEFAADGGIEQCHKLICGGLLTDRMTKKSDFYWVITIQHLHQSHYPPSDVIDFMLHYRSLDPYVYIEYVYHPTNHELQGFSVHEHEWGKMTTSTHARDDSQIFPIAIQTEFDRSIVLYPEPHGQILNKNSREYLIIPGCHDIPHRPMPNILLGNVSFTPPDTRAIPTILFRNMTMTPSSIRGIADLLTDRMGTLPPITHVFFHLCLFILGNHTTKYL
jgi:hypothetical protein